MEAIFFVIIVYAVFCGLMLVFQGFFYLTKRVNMPSLFAFRFFEIWVVVILPCLYLLFFDISETNDCCSESAVFSPAHRVSVYSLIILCTLAYFYQSYKKNIHNLVYELISSCFIIIGIAFNIIIGVHIGWQFLLLSLFGNIPIILLAVYILNRNHEIVIAYVHSKALCMNNKYGKQLACLLQKKGVIIYPVLSLICLPVLMLVILILLIFGQQPDAVIRAFTDTYKHGFSQLDYLCDNVQCGGHYLCSVAAKGHKKMVKPLRLGTRNHHLIICNRQLLVSNAFEELLQERLPSFHRFVRNKYNRVGNFIHKYYSAFDNPWISDVVYVMMKPVEWVFVVILYLCDSQPENRIACQYTDRCQDR